MSIALGCLVAVISSGVQSLGVTLQRKSYLPDPHYHHINQKHKRNVWLAGFVMFISANILGSVVQISTLPLIILSPLQSIGLIFNSVLSCVILHERFTHRLLVGTVSIAVGAFTIAYNGQVDVTPPGGSLDERFAAVWGRFTAPAFVTWFSATLGLCMVLHVAAVRSRSKMVRGFAYGVVSGTLTAHTFLFAKSLVDVVVATLIAGGARGILAHPTAHLLACAMLAIIGLQLTAFNLGLKEISTSVLYPLCFLVYNVCNLVNESVFDSLFSEHRMGYGQFAWVVGGLLGVLGGVMMISWDTLGEREVDCGRRVLSFEQEQLLDTMR